MAGRDRRSERCSCEVCGASVLELRRGRCTLCYMRWTNSRPVGLGAQCACCGERRHELLKSAELLGRFVPVCFNCAGRLGRLPRMPESFAGLRAVMSRDRRQRDRRGSGADTRVYKVERRRGDRRSTSARSAGEFLDVDDAMIVEVLDLAAYERTSGERGELTVIRDMR